MILDPVTLSVAIFAAVMTVPAGIAIWNRSRARKRLDASRFVRLRDMGIEPYEVRVGSKLIVLHSPGEGQYRFVRSVNGEMVELDSPWEVTPTVASQVVVVDEVEVR